MAWGTWRGVRDGGIAVLLLVALAPPTSAQVASPSPGNSPAKPAAAVTKPEKPTAPKTAATKPASVHSAKKIAQTKTNPPTKKFAAAPKKPTATKKIVATAKKPAPSAKMSVATAKLASRSPIAAAAATQHAAVTTTATHLPPLAAGSAALTSAATGTKTAAIPVSLTQPAATTPASRPFAAMPAEKAMTLPPVDVTLPAEAKTPVSFVSNFLKEAFRIAKLDGATSLQRRAQLADLFSSKMDVKRIAGYTTADELASLSSDNQQRFRAILVSYLVETYYPQLELASDPSVKVETAAAEPLADGTVVVWTTFTKDGWGSQSVQWRLTAANGGYEIVDIFSAGASLVQMERDTFQSVMRNGGLPELMAKLDARTKELASAATE
jgi:ABC-type transporter MlaC component